MTIELRKTGATVVNPALKKRIPSITTATRLETQPTAVGMKVGLQAGVADPLWFLARQWQFNEFQGEDAGTPMRVAFSLDGSQVEFWRAGNTDSPWQALNGDGVPLETRVEAEVVWRTHARLRGEAGLQLLRMASNSIREALLKKYPLSLPAPSDPQADPAGLQWSVLLNGRTVDAEKLAKDLKGLGDGAGGLTGLPAGLAIPGSEAAVAKTLLADWLRWFDDLLYEPRGDNPTWQQERMEYVFGLATGPLSAGASPVALAAKEYTDGHVDWEEFSAQPAKLDHLEVPAVQQFEVAMRHPTPVRYSGMPADRYWEFEDGAVNFAGAEAGITDLLRMTVTEFALTFGNDWFVVPVRLPVGFLYRVGRFQVVDSFGVPSNVTPVPDLQSPWRMFELSSDASLGPAMKHTMLLPDALDGVLEGPALEHTLLVRDEMANLAWAIEKKVQGVSGEPLDRDMEAKGLAFQQQFKFASPDPDHPEKTPQLAYRLATPVPANWTPLLPTRKPTLNLSDPLEIQLERAGMKRFFPKPLPEEVDSDYGRFIRLLDEQTTFIHAETSPSDEVRVYTFYPRGWLFRKDPTSIEPPEILRIQEEEVPRIGAAVRRSFQYARSADGRSWLWIGRSKFAGRGEASSNLRFDVAVRTTTQR